MKQKTLAFCSMLLLLVSCMTSCSPSAPESTGYPDTMHNYASSSATSKASTTETSVSTTSTSSTTSTAANNNMIIYDPLRIKWEDISEQTKRLLSECGVTYDDIFVDRSKLESSKKTSDMHPEYVKYYHDDREYTFYDVNGKLTNVSLPVDTNFAEAKTKAEIQSIVKTFAELFIDTKDYEYFDIVYDKTLRIYTASYKRVIHDYQTFSGITVMLYANGKIASFSINKIGIFDDVSIPTIDQAKIKQRCRELLLAQYPDMIDFELDMSDLKLDVKDGQLLAYYQKQPEIAYGTLVMICKCRPRFENKLHSRWEYVLVTLESI